MLEGLSGKAANADRKVTPRALAEYVRKSVKDWTYENQKSEQTPVLVASAAGDIILSDMALMKPARVTINNVTVPAIAQPVAVIPTPPTAVAGVDDAHTHVYYTGSSLGARLSQDPSQFKESPQRFSVKDGNHVADAMLNKTWVLYDTNEILNLADARSRAEQMGARLPTPQELASLLTLKRQKDDWSRVNGSVFPEHKRTSLFWTGSGTRSSLTTLRQVVDFSDGSLRKASSDDQYGVLLIVDK